MTTALVLGSADCVWENVIRAETMLGRFWDLGPIVACNDMIALWPRRLDHAVSLHTDRIPEWVTKRQGVVPWKGLPPFGLWTNTDADASALDELKWPFQCVTISDDGTGSSGLLATWAALEVADRALLCGITLNDRPYTPDATPSAGTEGWHQSEKHQEAWVTHKHDLLGRVVSMQPESFTAMLLGEPDPQFFR